VTAHAPDRPGSRLCPTCHSKLPYTGGHGRSATKQAAGATPPQVVEKLLYALRDEHDDARAAALDDDVVDHNVGPPMIRGRDRTVKFLRRGLSLPNAGFDVKIHHIAAEGTEVINDGPLDDTDRYQKVMYRGGDLGAFWSPPPPEYLDCPPRDIWVRLRPGPAARLNEHR
jgi:limonene-1,2-epoxide hydrolase